MSPPQLLLDENLSERVLPLLIERFPHSTHGRLIGLGGASDAVITKAIRSHGKRAAFGGGGVVAVLRALAL